MSRSRKKNAISKDSSNTYGKKLSARCARSSETRILKTMMASSNFELDFPHRYSLTNPWDVCDYVIRYDLSDGEWYHKILRK